MVDRVPTYPGRVRLVPVSGQSNIYDLTLADQPVQVGTPLSKANLLADNAAAAVSEATGTTPSTVSEAIEGLGNRSTDCWTVVSKLWSEASLGVYIYRNPDDITAASGFAYFHVGAIGPGLTYQWQYSEDSGTTWQDTSFVGNKTDTLRVTVATTRNGFQYRCAVKDSRSVTATSSAGTLTVEGA